MNKTEIIPVVSYLRQAADRFPARRALVGEDETTYRELYARVRRWATFLVRNGLAPGDRVAIWLPKRPEYVVGLYAAMEAGGTYVPMDGMQPAARAEKILASARPTVLVTDSKRWAQLEGLAPETLRLVILVDADGESTSVAWNGRATLVSTAELDQSEGAGEGKPVERTGDDIAAILFTSGSTGVPKGVCISYSNLHTFIAWATGELELSEHDVFSNHAGFHFDLSTFDLFAAAAVGAAVWIVRESEQRDLVALLDGLQRHRITVWYSVPSVLTLLVDSRALDSGITATLRYLLFAGEVFPIRHLRTLRESLPSSCVLYNLYGPTETNVCLFHRVRGKDLARDKPVYIGSPLPGQTAEVIDENGNPVDAEQEIGELVITGSCVTPGYWRLDDAANHENHRQGRHATGDLVGLEDALFFYHGRKDRMVKINGNRVELGEIEATLLRMPQLAEVAVVVDGGESARNIVAFFSTTQTASPPGTLEIKKHCGEHLPRYMIPRFVRHLDELPKNQNGKIDYPALLRMVVQTGSPQTERAV